MPDEGLDRLQARLAELGATLSRLSPAPPGPLAGPPLGVFDASFPPVATRSAHAPGDTEVVLVELPADFDPQVNLEATDATITVEIDVEPSVPDLWAVAEWEGSVLSDRFIVEESDERIRVARLPRPSTLPLRIEIRGRET